MSKLMTFAVGGREYAAEPVKIDRKKLYGWSEIHAFDDDGNECALVSTDVSGTIIIPKNGVGLGIETDDGKWVERGKLRIVNADGSDAAITPSSYSHTNTLTEKAADEELLDCSITAFYHLTGADSEFITAVGGDIYKFEYCYRDSYETEPAFILAAEVDGNTELFMFVGTQNDFEFIGLNESASIEESAQDEEEEAEELDFSMF